MEMEHRRFGTSGLSAPVLSFRTMTIGGPERFRSDQASNRPIT
jgi:aryl-alcohol dehydrogenase-like predicted oxidoreductase